MEMVNSLVVKIGDYLFAQIRRQTGYLIHYNRNTRNLKTEVERLDPIKTRVQHEVEAAKLNARLIEDDVDIWLKEVDEMKGTLDRFFQDNEENKRCLGGWCPNLSSRYMLSKEAAENTKVVIQLQQKGSSFRSVSYSARREIEYAATGTSADFVSRKSLFEEIMAALKDDDLNAVGICGLGGIGKTTMAIEVLKKAREEKLFDEVVMATVSQNPDFITIQNEIANNLHLEFKEDQSLPGRATQLKARLKNSKVLVILDDVWETLDLGSVGIPFGDDNKGCKVMLTSRSLDVCEGMKTRKDFNIGVLSESEAWHLFRQMAGDSIESPKLHSIAKEVLNECGGLPLAIVTVGRALEKKDSYMWNDALQLLRVPNPDNVPDFLRKVYGKLELSYNFLKNQEAQSLLLLCCVFKEDTNIPIEDLIRYGMGLILFKGIDDELAKAANRVRALVNKLRRCNLLSDIGNEKCVKMHDVVRDFIRFKAIEGNQELKELATEGTDIKCASVSLIFNKVHDLLLVQLSSKKIPFVPQPPDSLDHSQKMPDNLQFEGMEELKVLQLTSIFIPSSPPPLSFLTKIRTLCLHYCKLESISAIEELQTLIILSFRGSSIEELPRGIGRLTHLRLLDLSFCKSLKIISPGVISSLIQLEELYLKGSGLRWVVEGEGEAQHKVNLSELVSLSNLITLETSLPTAKFPDSIILFEKLVRFWIGTNWWWLDGFGHLCNPTKRMGRLNPKEAEKKNIELRNELEVDLDAKILVDSGFLALLKKTDCLKLRVGGGKNVLNAQTQGSFVQLKALQLSSSDDVEYLIGTGDLVPHSVFPILESLMIGKVKKLKMICHGQLPARSFVELRSLKLIDLPDMNHLWKGPTQPVSLGNLRSVQLSRCNRLKNLFSQSIATSLLQLEDLYISLCEEMEEIVATEREHGKEINKIGFPKLSELTLVEIPNLFNFCRKMDEIEFPQLSTLYLTDLSELRSICPNSQEVSEGNHDSATQHLFNEKVKSLCELRYMDVNGCKKLLNVFSSNLVQSLQNLEELKVNDCHLLEVVFDFEGVNIEEGRAALVLPCLKKLELLFLPSLTHLWKKAPQEIQGFQNLQSLVVVECRKLKYIFTLSIAKLLVKLEILRISECATVEIVGNDQEGSKENKEATKIIVFPKVKHLHFENLPDLVSFGPEPYTFKWPVLKKLSLRNANVKVFTLAILGAQEQMTINVRSHEEVQEQQITFPSLEVLEIKNEDNVERILNGLLPADSLCKLRQIRVFYCNKPSNAVPSNSLSALQNLEELIIRDCDSLVEVFEVEGLNVQEGDRVLLPNLKKLIFEDLPEFKHILKREPKGFLFFQRLEVLQVRRCKNLRNLFSPSMVKSVEKLQELEIIKCEMMTEIVAKDEGEGDEKAMDKIEFPQLRHLVLEKLPNLVSFSPKVNTTALNPKAIDVDSGEILSEFNFHTQIQHLFNEKVAFPSLEELKLTGYGSLRNVFYPSMARGLVHLKYLNISNCKMMEEIVVKGENKEEDRTDKIVIPQLEKLELSHLPSLTCFCQGLYPFDLPSLMRVSIHQCPKITTFSFESLITPKLQEVVGEYYLDQSFWMGDLNKTIQQLFARKFTFQGATKLRLSHNDNVELILHSLQPDGSLCKLREMHVEECNKLLHVIPSNFLQSFGNLEELTVRSCASLVEVFEVEGLNVEERDTMLLPKLKKLHLKDLTELKHLFNEKVLFSSLEKLILFQGLKSVRVERCGSLRNLFFPLMAKGLVRLEELVVEHCDMMEEIISKGEEEEEERMNTIMVIPQLKRLELYHLPNLVSFCHGHYAFDLPSLVDVFVFDCPKMKTFSSGFVSTKRLNQVHNDERLWMRSDIRQSYWIGDLNNTIQQLFQRKFTFPGATALFLSHNDDVELILHSLQPDGSLCKLREMHVKECNKLLHVIPSNFLQSFGNLKELTVRSCASLVEVFEVEGLNVEERDTVVLSKLEKLHLKDLTELKHLFNEKVLFPSLEKLILLQGLKSVRVECCNKLLHVVPSNFLQSLGNLEELTIRSCASLVEVFEVEGLNVEERETVLLPKLIKLHLKDLTELKRLFNEKVLFPSLEKLILFQDLKSMRVECCNKLLHVVPSNLLQSLGNLEELTVLSCASLVEVFEVEGLNIEERDTVLLPKLKRLHLKDLTKLKRLFNEKVLFPSLEKLILFQGLKSVRVECCNKLLHVVPSNLLQSLGNLEELTVLSCASLVEVFEVEGLNIEERDTVLLPKLKRLHLKDLTELKCLFNEKVLFPSLEKLILFQGLKSVRVECCNKLLHVVPSNLLQCLGNLEELTVLSCASLVEVFEVEGLNVEERDTVLLPKLKKLHLKDLTELKHLFNEKVLFPSLEKLIQGLKSVRVECFNKLLHIVPSNLLQCLGNLEELTVLSCASLVEVFEVEGLNIEERDTVLLPKLKKLHLKDLIELKRLFNEMVLFPSLEKLILFQGLKSVRVKRCGSLRNLFCPLMARGLVRLEELRIEHCDMMEEIISKGEEEEKEGMNTIMVIPRLKRLELYHLPKLVSFYQGRYAFDLPSLVDVFVFDCPKMKTFSSEFVSTKRLKQVHNCRWLPPWRGCDIRQLSWMGDLNNTIQQLFQRKELEVNQEITQESEVNLFDINSSDFDNSDFDDY